MGSSTGLATVQKDKLFNCPAGQDIGEGFPEQKTPGRKFEGSSNWQHQPKLLVCPGA